MDRRGRVPVHRRSQGRHDHPRRREHRPGGGRGRPAVAPGGGGGRGGGSPRRRVGAAGGGVHRAARRGGSERRRDRHLLPPAAGELQEAGGHPFPGRVAEESDGQDTAQGSAHAARRSVTTDRGPSRARRPPSRSPRPARGAAVELVVDGGIAWMTLARPGSRNRLDAELQGALVEACATVEDADEVRVVVLGARGPAFSAGLPPATAWPAPGWPDAVQAVAALTRPVIAAVQGDALGWGLALALACDLRVASTAAVLALPEVGQGRLPGGGAIARLARMVGTARTLDLVLLGTRLPAVRAAEWGLVAPVVSAGRFAAAVDATARQVAARGPLALRLGKEAVVRSLDLPLADGIRMEQDLYVLLQTTTDRREGVRAFLRRRAPTFRGR